ncbi:putative topoisomerase VIA, partial [Gregarina niphandrodes]
LLYVGDYDPHGIHIYFQYVCSMCRGESDEVGLSECERVVLLGIDPDTADSLPESHMPLTSKDITLLNNLIINP